MGLAMTAISNINPVGSHDADYAKSFNTSTSPQFSQSTRGLINHDVPVETPFGFQIAVRDYAPSAGSETRMFGNFSYTGFGLFRETIAEMCGRELREYWTGALADEPFAEILHFSDCEGAIGHEAAGDLLEDFRAHDKQFAEAHGEGHFVTERYREVTALLEIAAQNGVILFH